MSVYFVFCTEKKLQNTDLVLSQNKVELQKLHPSFFPYFYYRTNKRYFYFLDGALRYKRLSERENNLSFEETYIDESQKQTNQKFISVFRWIVSELTCGNSISLIRQIESHNGEERLRFNTIYERKIVSSDRVLSLSGDIDFEFHTEYEIQKEK